MKEARPEHCKGCVNFWNAGRKSSSAKYNNWCCTMGMPAKRAVGHCLVQNLKVEIIK